MSLVMGFITPYCVVMSGDYRRTRIDNESEHHDDAPKLFHVNEKVLIGVTGDYNFSRAFLYYLNSQKLDKATANAVARISRKWLREHSSEDTQQRVIIGGIADNSKPILIILSSDDYYKYDKRTVKPGRMAWALTYANVDAEPYINEELERAEEVNTQILAELARKVNERVANEDSFVSAKCYVAYIDIHAGVA